VEQDHPTIATTLYGLARLHEDQSAYQKAEPFYRQAIAIIEKNFPNGHPDLARYKADYNDMQQQWHKEKK